MDLVTVTGGEMLFQRFGPLSAQRQRTDSPAPERRGIWAFPFPHFDFYYAAHRFEPLMPKGLRRPSDFDPDLLATDWLTLPRTEQDRRYWAREAWLREHRHLFPVHRFWCAGPIWSHLDARGRYQGERRDWQQLSVSEFAQAVRRYHASAIGGRHVLYRYPDQERPRPCMVDDGALEVFLGVRACAHAR